MTVIRFFERRVLVASMFLASIIIALISPDMAIRMIVEAIDRYNGTRREQKEDNGQ